MNVGKSPLSSDRAIHKVLSSPKKIKHAVTRERSISDKTETSSIIVLIQALTCDFKPQISIKILTVNKIKPLFTSVTLRKRV